MVSVTQNNLCRLRINQLSGTPAHTGYIHLAQSTTVSSGSSTSLNFAIGTGGKVDGNSSIGALPVRFSMTGEMLRKVHRYNSSDFLALFLV